MKKALITGITGFVGSHLAELLLKEGVAVQGLLRWRSPLENIKGIQDQVELLHGDLRDLGSLVRALSSTKPDYIFHLAAQSYVPTSFNAPVDTLETNVIGTCNLLEAIRLTGIDPIVHICSSSEVYGQVSKEEVPIKECCPLRPASPYAVSKVGEDMLAYQYFQSYGIRTIRTRMFTHCGPRRGEVFVVSNFAKQIAEIELGLREPVIYVGNLDSVRTFADVRDTVRAYWLLVQHGVPGEVYNIGGETTMTINQMLHQLNGLSTYKNPVNIKVESSRLRPSDVTLQIPDCTLFKKTTGWEPKIPFSQTLIDMLNYWRERLSHDKK